MTIKRKKCERSLDSDNKDNNSGHHSASLNHAQRFVANSTASSSTRSSHGTPREVDDMDVSTPHALNATSHYKRRYITSPHRYMCRSKQTRTDHQQSAQQLSTLMSVPETTRSPLHFDADVGGYNSGDEYDLAEKWQLSEDQWIEKERSFERKLKKRGLVIHRVLEDGACLFRAVSHQVFGDEEMHDTVRHLCMDYIASNSDYFSQYITEELCDYVRRKRLSSVHGNHIEIQAISEMYNRTVEVLCYSTEACNVFRSNRSPPVISGVSAPFISSSQSSALSPAVSSQPPPSSGQLCNSMSAIQAATSLVSMVQMSQTGSHSPSGSCGHSSGVLQQQQQTAHTQQQTPTVQQLQCFPPIRLSYHRGTHYNSIINPHAPSVGVGLGLPGLLPRTVGLEQSVLFDTVKRSEQDLLEQTMFEDKLKCSDREATDDCVSEMVARESYIQWLNDNEKRGKHIKSPPASTTTSSTGGPCRSPTMSAGSCDVSALRFSPSHVCARACTHAPVTVSAASPAYTSHEAPFSDTLDACGFAPPATETASLFSRSSTYHHFDVSGWEDAGILAQVLAESQQEYLESLKKGKQTACTEAEDCGADPHSINESAPGPSTR